MLQPPDGANLGLSPNLRAARARFAQSAGAIRHTEAADKTQIGLVGQGVGAYRCPQTHRPHMATRITLCGWLMWLCKAAGRLIFGQKPCPGGRSHRGSVRLRFMKLSNPAHVGTGGGGAIFCLAGCQ